MSPTRVRDILREALPLLLAMALVEILAGAMLGRMEAHLEALPGLLALVPAVLAMRGNISTSMGSRLGSQARLGVIPRDKWISPVVWHNIVASLAQGVILSLAAAAIAHWMSLWFGFGSAGILVLAAIAAFAGAVSGLGMAVVALVTTRLALRRGLDLDNVAGPILMTASDAVTLGCLFWAAWLLGGV